MKVIIDSKSAVSGSLLHLKIRGFSIEVSDPSSEKIVISDDFGNISIEVIQCEDIPSGSESADIHEETKSIIEDTAEKHVEESTDLLFPKLVALRREIAKESKLPPYIIFHDTTLKDMALKLPMDLEKLKDVPGVGHTKLEKYGARFIEVIKAHIADSA